LEQSLSETKFLLDEAQSQIESEKTELSNLETVRKDLEAQRSFYTNEIKDNDIKGIYIFFIILNKLIRIS